jgi:3-hydroxyisobutyrate dehydrogenase-like beta-hydroxyacid dehydrogenase
MVRSVAVIGLGAMGAPMARRLRAAGFELTVCDADPAALDAFADAGVRIARSPADCAAADAVVVVVATFDQVLSAVLGTHGVLAGVMATHAPLLAVMSTVPAHGLEGLARDLQPSGIRVIDAPVSGGVIGAEQGTLTIMTGGDPRDIEVARPVFAALGAQHFHCGGVGAAQTMKLVNNIVCIANAVISAEAYELAALNGLALADVARVLEASTGRNYLSKGSGTLQATYTTMARTPAAFTSVLSILRKDLRLAGDLATRAGGAYPAIQELDGLLSALGEETYVRWRRVAGVPDESSGGNP